MPAKKKVIKVVIPLLLIGLGLVIVILVLKTEELEKKIETTPIPISLIDQPQTPESIREELELLKRYYVTNQLNIPSDYRDSSVELEKIAHLMIGVIKREISWRRGGCVFVSFVVESSDPAIDPSVYKESKELAWDKISEYHARASVGEEISELVEAAKQDPVIKNLNKTFKDSVLVRNPLFYLHTEGMPPVVNDQRVDDAVFKLNEGGVSEILTLSNGYVFVVVSKIHEGSFSSYEDWLSDASSGKLEAPVVKYYSFINPEEY